MTDFVFNLLESIGFTHPLHPPITHIPMGLAFGGFTFALFAYFFKKPQLYKSSYHCSIFALIGIPPTIISGVLDWLHSYGGEWLPAIKIKVVMAVLMTIFLIVVVYLGKEAEKAPVRLLLVYSLVIVSACVLGYWGGDLIFG